MIFLLNKTYFKRDANIIIQALPARVGYNIVKNTAHTRSLPTHKPAIINMSAYHLGISCTAVWYIVSSFVPNAVD